MLKRNFSCLWSRDASAKKHKRWFDGTALFSSGVLSLSQEDGQKISSCRLSQAEAVSNLVLDNEFRAGGFSILFLSEESDLNENVDVHPNKSPVALKPAQSTTKLFPSSSRRPLKFLQPSSKGVELSTESSNNHHMEQGSADNASHHKTIVSKPSMEPYRSTLRKPFKLLQHSLHVPEHGSVCETYQDRNDPTSNEYASTLQESQKSILDEKIASKGDDQYSDALTGFDLVLEVQQNKELKLGISMSKNLKPHQRDGVLYLWKCLTRGRPRGFYTTGAILADEMGLGKTLTALALISAMLKHSKSVKKVVVTCPSSLVNNWATEVKKWCGCTLDFKTVTVNKGGSAAAQQVDDFRIGSHQRYALLIISYDLYRAHAKCINRTSGLGLLVCDEGHRLKNCDSTKTFKSLIGCPAPLRLMITGTPIQNNLEEFFSLANFVCPGILGDLKEFRDVYARPIEAGRDTDAAEDLLQLASDRRDQLSKIMETFVLRRDKSIAASSLTAKTEITVFCKPTKIQEDLYINLLENSSIGIFLKNQNYEQLGGAYDGVLPLIANLRKACNHPDLFDPNRFNNSSGQVNNNSTESPNESFQSKGKMAKLGKVSTPPIFESSASGKLNVLEYLLFEIRKCSDDRVVLCSNFTSTLDLFQGLAQKHSWKYLRLDGSTASSVRQSLVDTFNRKDLSSIQDSNLNMDSSPFLFLLSTKAGGCGLNLIGGNRLVLYDQDWNPSTCQQTMARVWRFGQSKPVIIYRFITTGTLEETIFQRQLLKGELFNVVRDQKGVQKDGKSQQFNIEELKDLFTLRTDTISDTRDKLTRSGQNHSSWAKEYTGHSSVSDQHLATILKEHKDVNDFVTYVHTACTDFGVPTITDKEFKENVQL